MVNSQGQGGDGNGGTQGERPAALPLRALPLLVALAVRLGGSFHICCIPFLWRLVAGTEPRSKPRCLTKVELEAQGNDSRAR